MVEARTGRTWWRVALPAVLVAMVMIFQVSFGNGVELVTPSGWQLVLIFHGAAALLFRYRYPLGTAAATILAGSALQLVTPHTAVDVASVAALYTLATLAGRRTTWTTALVAAVLLTVTSDVWLSSHLLDFRNLLAANYVVIAVAIGDSVRNSRVLLAQARERALTAERTREEEARRRVGEERIRIARELHDVVAHHITLVNAQAGIAHHLLRTYPDKAYQALADIKETSRTALDELRATVGLLRQDDDPPESLQPVPRFEQVEELLAAFRTAGYDVDLAVHGTARPLTGTADLAAYRIVQEALTNAGKHGTRPDAHLDLAYTDDALLVTVTNPAHADRKGPGTGHGLIGMRERAEAAGGTFTAALRADDTYEVRAALPLHRPS